MKGMNKYARFMRGYSSIYYWKFYEYPIIRTRIYMAHKMFLLRFLFKKSKFTYFRTMKDDKLVVSDIMSKRCTVRYHLALDTYPRGCEVLTSEGLLLILNTKKKKARYLGGS